MCRSKEEDWDGDERDERQDADGQKGRQRQARGDGGRETKGGEVNQVPDR